MSELNTVPNGEPVPGIPEDANWEEFDGDNAGGDIDYGEDYNEQ